MPGLPQKPKPARMFPATNTLTRTRARWACTGSWKARLAAARPGKFPRFDVFKGPIFDNKGNQILADGVSLEQLDLDGFKEFGSPCKVCMYWWADGITAELPTP